MRRKGVLAVALVLCLASYARAALSIVVPNISVQDPGSNPGTFPINIMVTGDGGTDLAAGADLHAQIGPNLPGPNPPNGIPLSPTITAVIASNTFTGSFFNNAPRGATLSNTFTDNWNVNKAITTNLNDNGSVATVPAAGLLVTLQVNYTGFHSGTWPILLSGAGINGPTDIFSADGIDFSMVITDGSFTITAAPEPSALALALWAAAGLVLVAIRQRRAIRA